MGPIQLPSAVSHGNQNAYDKYGCRCQLCMQGHSAYRAAQRARNPIKYTTYMREYMRKYRARKRAEH
jgi:hypothetical protein